MQHPSEIAAAPNEYQRALAAYAAAKLRLEMLAPPVRVRRPTPRLHTAIARLGLAAAPAAFTIYVARNGDAFERESAREMIRVALLQRRTPLAMHPDAPRDPSTYRKGFGRFPDARGFYA